MIEFVRHVRTSALMILKGLQIPCLALVMRLILIPQLCMHHADEIQLQPPHGMMLWTILSSRTDHELLHAETDQDCFPALLRHLKLQESCHVPPCRADLHSL